MFQKDLGSLLDKSQRVEALVPALGAAAGLEGGRAGGLWRGGCGGNAVNALVCGSVGLLEANHRLPRTDFLPAPPAAPPTAPCLPADAVPVAAQAAHLCKADLATSMVTEMTALAGTMGRHYALKEGLPAGKPLLLAAAACCCRLLLPLAAAACCCRRC